MEDEREITPRIDALASQGIVFDQAITVSTNTLISHASMLTGLYPGAHGTTYIDEGTPLQETYCSLAEDFEKAGYQTAGFAAHASWLNERYGINQGFQAFKTGDRSADEVLGDAMAWFEERDRGRPFFLFIHLYDVHSDFKSRPYDCPPPFKGSYTKQYDGPLKIWEDQAVKGSEFLLAVHRGQIEISPEDLAYLSRQYDEGLSYTDHRLGAFIDSLDSMEDTFITITADHGEEFQEHGGMLHNSNYDEVMRVPLIIVPPSSYRKILESPRRISDQVCIVDIRPTLLSLAGLPAPPDCQGMDLLPWLLGHEEACPSGPVPFRNFGYDGVQYRGYKMLLRDGHLELYDLKADPGELENLVHREAMKQVVDSMIHLVSERKKEDHEIREIHLRNGVPRTLTRDPEAEEKLRKLGYVR